MGFDWNQNGKRDMFDSFVDYQVFQEIFENEEMDSGFDDLDDLDDFDGTDEYGADDLNDEDELDYSDYVSKKDYYFMPHQEDAYANEIYGLREIAYKRSEDVLRILIQRKKEMADILETCSVESGLREIRDNRQMNKDFWLYEFAKILEHSRLEKEQSVKLLQLLLDTFQIENPMTAERHYWNMDHNEKYRKYMYGCFGIIGGNCGAFFVLLGLMSGNEGERLQLTMDFTKQLIKFMMQLEEYLHRMFPVSGFGNQMQWYIKKLLDCQSHTLNRDAQPLLKEEYITNPVFPQGSAEE